MALTRIADADSWQVVRTLEKHLARLNTSRMLVAVPNAMVAGLSYRLWLCLQSPSLCTVTTRVHSSFAATTFSIQSITTAGYFHKGAARETL
ncbi:hypothetical protein Tco_0024548 [Tanacetum coccineum]